MFCNPGKQLCGVVLVLSVQGAFSGEVWLVIVADPPGVAGSVNNTYHSRTSWRPSEILRIQVPKKDVRDLRQKTDQSQRVHRLTGDGCDWK